MVVIRLTLRERSDYHRLLAFLNRGGQAFASIPVCLCLFVFTFVNKHACRKETTRSGCDVWMDFLFMRTMEYHHKVF